MTGASELKMCEVVTLLRALLLIKLLTHSSIFNISFMSIMIIFPLPISPLYWQLSLSATGYFSDACATLNTCWMRPNPTSDLFCRDK